MVPVRKSATGVAPEPGITSPAGVVGPVHTRAGTATVPLITVGAEGMQLVAVPAKTKRPGAAMAWLKYSSRRLASPPAVMECLPKTLL